MVRGAHCIWLRNSWGKRHEVGLHPVVTGEKPSGQAFTEGVQPVTRRVLCTLNQIREQVFRLLLRAIERAVSEMKLGPEGQGCG